MNKVFNAINDGPCIIFYLVLVLVCRHLYIGNFIKEFKLISFVYALESAIVTRFSQRVE